MPMSSSRLIVPLGRPITKQFMCFTAIGAVGTAAHYAILVALVHMLAADPVAASIGGFVAGAFVNYFANYHVTFQSKKRHEEAFIKFLSVALLGLGLNTLIMAFATNLVGLHYLISQVIATGMVLVWNFVGNRFWTFREATCAKPRL